MFHQGRILYTSLVKLFWKKGGSAFWHYNIIRIWAMSGPFSRFLVIFYPLSPRTPFKNVFQHTFISCIMNIWLHNILCDFFYPFKTQGWIILGRTVLMLSSVHRMSALFRSEFYTRMKRYWGENISIYRIRNLVFKVKLFLKQGISHQLGRDAVVRFECENSAIDVIINFLWKINKQMTDYKLCSNTI
jgi:hypothetical protein